MKSEYLIEEQRSERSSQGYNGFKTLLAGLVLILLALNSFYQQHQIQDLQYRLSNLESEKSLEAGGVRSRRSVDTNRDRHGNLLRRNNHEETYFTQAPQNPFRGPKGLREIFERLPPVDSSEEEMFPVRFETRALNPGVVPPAMPPVTSFNTGRDRVSARVIDFRSNDRDVSKSKSSSSAHFVADVSNYTSVDNPRLRNANGVFQIWRPAQWMKNSDFRLEEQSGTVAVHTSGLFFIYAQIHYHDDKPENSFAVEVNQKKLVQCTTSDKGSSCYTGALAMLHSGDKILLRNLGLDRFSIYSPEKSFFGVVKVDN